MPFPVTGVYACVDVETISPFLVCRIYCDIDDTFVTATFLSLCHQRIHQSYDVLPTQLLYGATEIDLCGRAIGKLFVRGIFRYQLSLSRRNWQCGCRKRIAPIGPSPTILPPPSPLTMADLEEITETR